MSKKKVHIWSSGTGEIRELFHPTEINGPSFGFHSQHVIV
jgi:hypothetical protein